MPNRKIRNNLKNIDGNENSTRSEYRDLPITPAVKTVINKPNLKQDTNFNTRTSMTSSTANHIIMETPEFSNSPEKNNKDDLNNLHLSPDNYEDFYSDEEDEPVRCENH